MKHLYYLLALALTFAACSKSETEETPPPPTIDPVYKLESLAFDRTSVRFDKENTINLVLTVTPAEYVPLLNEFVLLEAGSDKIVTDITLKFTGENDKDAGKYGVQLVYKGAAEQTFKRSVELRYADTQTRTSALELLNPPHMPAVYIETTAPVKDKETWIDATVRIDGGGYFDDLATTQFLIRGRGNSTWAWDKKPYAMKFPSKTEVLGMPKHKRWCLIANFMDRTHMRNRIAYHLGANSKLAYTTRNQYAELYLNGKYEGLYLLTEQIKDGKERVNISDEAGFLLEFDTNYDEDVRFRSTTSNIPVNVKFPDPEDLATERLDALKAYINQLDKAIQEQKSGGTTDPLAWVDQTSMIDFWIIFELMSNHEMLHPKSVYFHKEGNGKLIAGPIWDFDYETLPIHRKTGWVNYGDNLYASAPWRDNNWWVVLLKYNASFRAATKARWKAWRPFLQTVPDFIRAEQKYISTAVARDNKRWPTITADRINGDTELTFDQAAARIIEVYQSRLQWIDTQISGW